MRRVLLAAAVVAAALAALGGLAEPAGATPSVTLSTTYVAPGGSVLVQGAGWPARALVRVTVCGNNALDESADCDLAGGTSAGVGANGYFSTRLTVQRPPTPCPCVVVVNNASGAIPVAETVITIVGVPIAKPHSRVADPTHLLRIEDAHLEGKGPWGAWFGGSAHRTLVLVLHDVGDIKIPATDLTINLGKGPDSTKFVPAKKVRALQPGERRELRIPVTLDAFSWGRYQVSGGVIGYDARFKTTTSTYWWAWIAIAFVLANIVVWRALHRLALRAERKRQQREPGAAGTRESDNDDQPALT